MHQHKILIVDDDFASRLLIKKALKNEDFALTLCSDGLEALEILEKQKYDLVVTDLVMEGVNGMELLEKIKTFDTEMAVILLTGHASIETAIEAVRLGASDYLVKPINLEELRIRIKKAIERVELERKLKIAERNLTYNATIARANHEINQPLTVIISAADMVRLELDRINFKHPKINNYLDLLTKASMRIANILRKLREIDTPKIQSIPHGMQMIELDVEKTVPLSDKAFILIIEDEENIRRILREMLESVNYKVILAETAKEGLEIYQKDRANIRMVILDYNLPDNDGLSILKKLRKINPDIRVLLTSGFNVEQKLNGILKPGRVEFIRKPFNRSQFLENLQRLYPAPQPRSKLSS